MPDVLRLTLVLGLPVVFNPWGTSAFELPKAMFLRMFVIFLCWVTLLAYLERPPQRTRSSPAPGMLWASGAFILSLLLATVFSYDPHTSLWGALDRQQGLLTVTAYLALFWLTASQVRRWGQVDRLWSVLVWGSGPVVLYGLLQGIGVRPLGWQTDAASPVLSTLGRANFFGSYLVLIIPLTAARAKLARDPRPLLCLLAGQLVCWLLTLARGAWMGLGAAVVIGAWAWAYAEGHRRAAWTVLVLALLGTGSLVLLMILGASNAALAEFHRLGFLTSLVNTDAGSVAARLAIWRTTLPMIAARPWLGYGPETIWPLFMRVFPPELVYYHGRGVIVDRAHNLWLDLGMRAGLLGGLAFAALLLATFGQIRRGLLAGRRRAERILWIALAAALGGHLVDLHVTFDLTTTGMIFWLLLALVAALSRRLNGAGEDVLPVSVESLLKFRYFVATLIVLALVGQLALRPLLADVAYWRSRQPRQTLDTRLQEAERAVRLWSLEPTYRLGLAELYAQQGDCAAANAQMTVLRARRSDDPQVWAAWGSLHAQCGDRSRTEAAWREAIRLAPNLGLYHRRLGWILANHGELEQAADTLQRAVALDATDVTAYRWLGEVYQALGKEEAAQEAYRQAEYWSEQTVE